MRNSKINYLFTVKTGGGTLHSYVAQQLGKEKNKHFLEDQDVRASILRHAEAVSSCFSSAINCKMDDL